MKLSYFIFIGMFSLVLDFYTAYFLYLCAFGEILLSLGCIVECCGGSACFMCWGNGEIWEFVNCKDWR